jgi:hypothetical protein
MAYAMPQRPLALRQAQVCPQLERFARALPADSRC